MEEHRSAARRLMRGRSRVGLRFVLGSRSGRRRGRKRFQSFFHGGGQRAVRFDAQVEVAACEALHSRFDECFDFFTQQGVASFNVFRVDGDNEEVFFFTDEFRMADEACLQWFGLVQIEKNFLPYVDGERRE